MDSGGFAHNCKKGGYILRGKDRFCEVAYRCLKGGGGGILGGRILFWESRIYM